MTLPVQIVDLWATFLWCHAFVLAGAWFRAVARTERREHVGHVVSLIGEMVPMAAGVVILIFAGSFFGLPSAVVFLAIALPAGLVLALVFEVDRVGTVTKRSESRRLAVALGLTIVVYAFRSMT